MPKRKNSIKGAISPVSSGLPNKIHETILTIWDNGHASEHEVKQLLDRTYDSNYSLETILQVLIKYKRIKIEKCNGLTITTIRKEEDEG